VGATPIAVGTRQAGGSNNANMNAIDLVGNVDTRVYEGGVAQPSGGNLYLAGTSSVTSSPNDSTPGNRRGSDIVAIGAVRSLSTGTGNITFVQSELGSYNSWDTNGITLNTTGVFSIIPVENYFYNAAASGTKVTFTWNGTNSSSNLIGTASLDGLTINSIANLGGLVIGKSSSDNNSDMTLSRDLIIAGPVTVYGGRVQINGNLTSNSARGTTGITLNAKRIIQGDALSAFTVQTPMGADISYRAINSPQTAGTDYAIWLGNSNIVRATQGGNIRLDASFTDSGVDYAGDDIGILISGNSTNGSAAILAFGGGDITINADISNLATSSKAYGIDLQHGTSISTDTGDIDIKFRRRTTSEQTGLWISARNTSPATITSSSSGNITITDETIIVGSGLLGHSIGGQSTSYLTLSGSVNTSTITIRTDHTLQVPNRIYISTPGHIVYESVGTSFSGSRSSPPLPAPST
jgi:hypothetical protein